MGNSAVVVPDGLDAEKRAEDGKWRWTWLSAGGASYMGVYKYRTKKAALEGGVQWLAEFEQQ